MHLSFDNLGEFEEFARYCGFAKVATTLDIGPGVSTGATFDVHVGVHGDELALSPVAEASAAAPTTPAKRTRRTKAEIEADRARAEAAMAAPLEAEAPEAGDPAAAALAALAGAADDKPPYVDMATYAAQHSARLAETVTPKDFLTTCQAFIAKHQLPAYMELLTTVGIAPTAVASCTAEQRGNILARMEWHDTEFAPVK